MVLDPAVTAWYALPMHISVILRKRRWGIVNLRGIPRDSLGKCDYAKRKLRIPYEGDTRDELDVILHESVHACMPYLHEDEVNESATDLARLLWKLGWRKTI